MMNLSQKSLVFSLLILLVLSSVNAASLVSSDVSSLYLCPREIGLFVDNVKNADSAARSYAVSLSGEGAEWATTAQTNFILAPGEEKKVYTYATPSGSADVGDYNLKIDFDDGANTRSLNHVINVKDCFGVGVATGSEYQSACPNDAVNYRAVVKNEGEFSDTFSFGVSGELADFVSLSKDAVVLDPGESQEITLFVNSPADSGKYSFKLTAQNTRASRSADFVLDVNSCYDYNLTLRRGNGEYSLCEHSVMVVPINIKNAGTVRNSFELDLRDSLIWTRLDTYDLDINVNEANTFNLVAAPDYGVDGNFSLSLEVVPQRGRNAEAELSFEVRDCHSVDVNIELEEEVVCKRTSETYTVEVINDGEVEKEYGLSVAAPIWLTLEKNEVSLDPGESAEITLVAEPSSDALEKRYEITVTASSSDASNSFDSDSFFLDVKGTDVCFKPALETKHTDLSLGLDSELLVPISLTNEGTENGSYRIGLSGSAADFSVLANNEFELGPSEKKEAAIYIAPELDTELGNYVLNLDLYVGEDLYETRVLNVEITDDQTRWTVIDGVSETEEENDEDGLRDFVRNYKYYLLGGLFIFILIILAVLFGRKAVDFFDEEFEEEKQKKRKRKTL